MKHVIREINVLEYLKDFSAMRTPLTDFYVRSKPCKIIALYDERGSGRGFLLTEDTGMTEVLFLTAEGGDPGMKKSLLRHLANSLPKGSQIRWRITGSAADEHLAYQFGFYPGETLNIYRTVGAGDERLASVIREYEKLFTFMEKRGYRTVSFEALTAAQLDQIRNDPDGEFDAALRPAALMENTAGGFSPQMSFVSLKGEKVAAYTVVRQPDGKSCIFEIICVAESEKKTGVFILPFLSSLKAMRSSGAEEALFAIYEDNNEPMKIVKKRFAQLILSQSVQHNLLYIVR